MISGVVFHNPSSLSNKGKLISFRDNFIFNSGRTAISSNGNAEIRRTPNFLKNHQTNISLKSFHVEDIASCRVGNTSYALDSNNNCVWQVKGNGEELKVWCTFPPGEEKLFCKAISTTYDDEVLILRNFPPTLYVYGSDAELLRTIPLPKEMKELQHAVKCPVTGHYIISHGFTGKSKHRICRVTCNGTLMASYGGERGRRDGHLDCPAHLAVDENGYVFVADKNNNRVLLLHPSLKKVKIMLSEYEDAIHSPYRLCYDAEMGKLLVGHGKCLDEYILRPRGDAEAMSE